MQTLVFDTVTLPLKRDGNNTSTLSYFCPEQFARFLTRAFHRPEPTISPLLRLAKGPVRALLDRLERVRAAANRPPSNGCVLMCSFRGGENILTDQTIYRELLCFVCFCFVFGLFVVVVGVFLKIWWDHIDRPWPRTSDRLLPGLFNTSEFGF